MADELTIPQAHQPVLTKVRTMLEDPFQSFVSALQRPPGDVSSVQGLSPVEAGAIKEVVMELYRVREFFNMEVPEFVSDIGTGLQRIAKFPETELPAFKERLTRLLTLDSLAVATKAASLKLEYERRFCTARILTDVRPVYGVDPADRPDAAMIMHTLRITYHDDTSELREIYITMDDDDLFTLRELIDRAEDKTKSIQSILAAANVPIAVP